MAKAILPLLFFLVTLFKVGEGQITHRSKIFLAENEAYLFFPHRHFQFISTYTSNCSAKPAGLALYHEAMTNVAGFDFNNSNLGISILSEEATSTVFYYAKINLNGICSVYEVDQSQIRILYEYNFAGEFTHVILLDKFHAFLWNCENFVRLEYSLFSRGVNIMRGSFEVEDSWNCQKYKEGVMLCWGSKEIKFFSLEETSSRTEVYEWSNDEAIRVILPLDRNEGIFFICSFTICNITQLLLNRTITVIDTFPFVLQILGGDFNPQTNQIVIIHPATAVIFTYNSHSYTIRLQESLDFYSDLECVFIENVRFLNEQILVNCNNFMGEAEHLALIRDRELNRFFSYQPMRNADPDNPCLFDGNQKYIFALCKRQIATMMNNFAYFQIDASAGGQAVTIECLDVEDDAIKIPENFELMMVSAEYGLAYVNQPVWTNKSINFDDILTLKLRDKFTASAIDHYTVSSEDCPYLKELTYDNIDAQFFVSLYIKERCVQVAAADNRNFYRVLQLNDTLFYLEICTLVKVAFACQLYEIIEDVLVLRLLVFDFRLFKLYIREGNLLIEQQGGLSEIVFEEAANYEMRDQVIRVHSRNKIFINSVSNVINNCGGWIEEVEHLVYLFAQHDIYEVDAAGRVTQYRNGSKRLLDLQLQLPRASSQGKLRPFALPYLLSKGYFLFLINDTHITKLYNLQTSIIIYQLPYNTQGYEVESVHSVENFIVIQYGIGFFEIYDTERESVAALVAVQQEEVLCDIVLMDRDVILVPLRGQKYLLRIQTDPVFIMGPLPPSYNKFNEQCSFLVSPHLANGSCPGLEPPVSQAMNLSIKFSIQKIELQTQTLLLQQPRECSPCAFEIAESLFSGPIFTYELNDDDYGTFQLLSHLNVEDCEAGEERSLLRMVEVRTADQNTRSELLMMNATHLLLLDSSLKEIYNATLMFNTLCISYTSVEDEYLLLCEHDFLLFGKGSPLTAIPHNISLASYPASQFEVKSEFVREGIYYVYIREEQLMYIQLLCLASRTVEPVSVQELSAEVMDFAVVRDNIITLEDGQICISASTTWRATCYQLDTIIPRNYAQDYDYGEFLTYFATEACLRALLISKTNQNLHVDIEINLEERPIRFTLLNAYTGYIGYELRGIVSINTAEGGYSNFLLHYDDTKDLVAVSLIAYYQFNPKFAQSGEIGQIRSVLFLSNYFQVAAWFSFLSFPHRLYVTNLTQLASPGKQYKKCVSVRVEDRLQVVANYREPSHLKFLVLKVKNINDLRTYYIKIAYDPEPGLLRNSLIGLAIVLIIFVVLAVAINRCQEASSELTIHFMSEDIEREFSEDNPSSLLHSNSSPSSPRSYSPSQSQDELD